jgi:hypothetical protein
MISVINLQEDFQKRILREEPRRVIGFLNEVDRVFELMAQFELLLPCLMDVRLRE